MKCKSCELRSRFDARCIGTGPMMFLCTFDRFHRPLDSDCPYSVEDLMAHLTAMVNAIEQRKDSDTSEEPQEQEQPEAPVVQ